MSYFEDFQSSFAGVWFTIINFILFYFYFFLTLFYLDGVSRQCHSPVIGVCL